MTIENEFTKSLNIRFPLVMAPMFLVSNEEMIRKCIESGILGCFPSLNYRQEGELEKMLIHLNEFLASRKGQPGTYGVNLIVQQSNPWFEKHLAICVRNKVPVYITSLGKPKSTIEAAHAYGAKVFCDVTNLTHADKCFHLGCDGFVAVGQGAGGHAGPYPLSLLIDALHRKYPNKPILAAGGIADGKGILSVLSAGASAAYCGTRFIATPEAPVSDDYKNAIVNSHMEDIVLTERISGTPCTIINTEFAKKIGTKQNSFERWLNKNPRSKKYFKMLVQQRGFNWLEASVKPGNHHNLWCAGQSVELIKEILPMQTIIEEMIRECESAYRDLKKSVQE